jgi:beta-glucanase (GH16 family)
MLGDNRKMWPTCGEIDIMEFIGKEPNKIYATVHAPGYSGGNGVGSNTTVPAAALRDEFHVYAVEWEENEIRWYFDDQEYFKITPKNVPAEWVFDHPFFIILNLAVGGRWPGYPDETTIFPQFLYVDYVRVYQKP